MSIAQNWSRENLAWAAGLFEGEGCISITGKPPSGRRIVLALGMTDEDVVRKFHHIIGLGHVGNAYRSKSNPGHYKLQWRWSVTSGRQAQAVLAALWSFLGSRRKAKAEEAIKFFSAQQVWNKNRLACLRGHLYTPENIYHHKRGGRACKSCAAERRKKKNNNGSLNIRRSSHGDNVVDASL